MDIYPIKPNRISQTGSIFKTRIVEFENGVEQRSPQYFMRKRTFTLEHNTIDNTKLAIIQDFFESMQGSYKAFLFNNHVDGLQYKVRFKDDTLQIERINAFFSNVRVDIIEC
jgi:hypothetical protein